MYGSNAGLIAKVPEAKLILLTDDAKVGVVNWTLIDTERASVDALINAYCGTKYSVPFTTVPDVIDDCSDAILARRLYARKVDEVSESIQKGCDDAIQFLKDIAKGTASLGVEPAPTATTQGSPETNKTECDRIFTRDKMSGY